MMPLTLRSLRRPMCWARGHQEVRVITGVQVEAIHLLPCAAAVEILGWSPVGHVEAKITSCTRECGRCGADLGVWP